MEETPEQIAHEVAAAWIMGPINMGDLEERIAAAIRIAISAQREPIAQLRNLLRQLTDDERMEVFAAYCTSCGSADPSCQCWNDE